MAIVKVRIDDDLLDYYKEHAIEKERSLSNLFSYAIKRYCSINPLSREKEEKRK